MHNFIVETLMKMRGVSTMIPQFSPCYDKTVKKACVTVKLENIIQRFLYNSKVYWWDFGFLNFRNTHAENEMEN